MPAIRFLVPTAFALWLLAATAAPSAAATCADRPVTARGDPSRFETLAKAKVRALPALGAAYADWNKALAADYRCSDKDGRYVCFAVAHPCRD